MNLLNIVLDTNVFVAALRSQQGASYKLLQLIDADKFQVNLSVPLVFEYEDAAKRIYHLIGLPLSDIDDILDYLCKISMLHQIFYLWRPFLPDPKDDMVLELAVTAQCEFIVTFNKHDFAGMEQFGIKVVTPQEFLRIIGEL